MDLPAYADVLRKALSESQANSDKLTNILGSFDERLSVLEADMRPTQVNCYSRDARHGAAQCTRIPSWLCNPQYPASAVLHVAEALRRARVVQPSRELLLKLSPSFAACFSSRCVSHTQESTHAFRKAHVNIDRTVKAMEVVLSNYSVAREVRS